MYRIVAVAIAAVLGAIAISVSSATAATIVIADSIDDYETQRRSDTGVYIASENFGNASRVGFQSNFNGFGANHPGGIESLFFFQLPALPAGHILTGATFSVGRLPDSATTAVTPAFNGDLYALGVVGSISKTAADAQKFFYLGNTPQVSLPAAGPTVGGAVSRVDDDFLVPADFIPNSGAATVTPDTADVTAYIKNLYANPSANGFTPGTSYLVMRVNPDTDTPPNSGTQRYFLAFQGTASNGGAGTPENRPLLTLETIPEPGSFGMLIIGSLALLAFQRRID